MSLGCCDLWRDFRVGGFARLIVGWRLACLGGLLFGFGFVCRVCRWCVLLLGCHYVFGVWRAGVSVLGTLR